MKYAFRTTTLAIAAVACSLCMTAPANATLYGYTSAKGDPSFSAYPNDTAMGNLTRADVRLVQKRLSREFYKGSIDGHWGPQTTAAVSAFQDSCGLPPDGRMTRATLQELNLATSARYERAQDIEPAAGGGAYDETTVTSDVYTTRSRTGFASKDFDAQNSTCMECTDGIFGNGGNPNGLDE